MKNILFKKVEKLDKTLLLEKVGQNSTFRKSRTKLYFIQGML